MELNGTMYFVYLNLSYAVPALPDSYLYTVLSDYAGKASEVVQQSFCKFALHLNDFQEKIK